jgi:hypothetical protein
MNDINRMKEMIAKELGISEQCIEVVPYMTQHEDEIDNHYILTLDMIDRVVTKKVDSYNDAREWIREGVGNI